MMPQPARSQKGLGRWRRCGGHAEARKARGPLVSAPQHPARVRAISTTGATMRLSFPNAEHTDVIVNSGVLSIGSAQGNAITLSADGVRPWHARLVLDARGVILEVLDAQARTHVNARPVLEKAFLRLGDVVNIDAVAMVLKPDRDDVIETFLADRKEQPSGPRPGLASVVLRGVSGTHFGKTIAVGERLVVGQGNRELDLDEPGMAERHAVIEAHADAIELRDLGSANGTEVNGVRVKNAVLYPGDQLAFGRNRFVLEAPGYPARGQSPLTPAHLAPSITQTMPPIDIPDPLEPGSDRSSHGIWWLIAAAAVIGLGIASLLWLGSR
jgi:pSer/pThr/pTyr-binding forkhead associated (FHA) protein